MKDEGIDVKTSHHVKGLRWGPPGASPPYNMDPKRCLTLATEEEGEVGVGMCVWVTGNAMTKLVNYTLKKVDEFPTKSVYTLDPGVDPSAAANQSWEFKKVREKGALLVDGHLRVQLQNEAGQTAVLNDVFALGDNAMPETGAPPATAQATFQEAKWLATHLNKKDLDKTPPFSFKNLGTMAYIGSEKALMQIPHDPKGSTKYLPEGLTGRMASIVWNMAYITMSISWRNKLRVAFRWALNRLFGRDISRF
jgi:NADH dehydrogenase